MKYYIFMKDEDCVLIISFRHLVILLYETTILFLSKGHGQ